MMRKKLAVSAIIILLICAGFVLTNYVTASQFEDSQFDLPEGFSRGEDNKNGDMNITNGNSTLFITKFKAEELNKSITNYKSHCEKNNLSVQHANFKLNNIDVYKITVIKSGASHYWFTHDGIGYSIYTWKKVDNCDAIVDELIKNMIK